MVSGHFFKPLLGTPALCYSSDLSTGSSVSKAVPAHTHRKRHRAMGTGSSAWVPASLVQNPDEIHGSWLRVAPAMAVLGIWRVK